MSKNFKTRYLKTSTGEEIFVRTWESKNKNGSVIIMLHTIGTHSLIFEEMAEYFLKFNFNIYSFDFSGFGKSKGSRGHIENFDIYINETLAILKLAEMEYPDVPKFILGESMGALVGLNFAKYYQDYFDGLILLSPLVGTTLHIPYKKAFDILLSSIFKKLSLYSLPFTNEMLTRDYRWQGRLLNDELNLKEVTAKFYVVLNNVMQECLKVAKKIQLPVLVIQAGEDLIVDLKKVVKFFNNLNSSEKQFFILKNFYHLLSVDVNREIVYKIILDWIIQRLYLIANYEKFEK